MKKLKSVTVGGLALVLAISLVAGACAPAAPEEGAEEIAELEDEVAAEKAKTAAEKAKVSDLEDEIAALKKPAEVIEITLECISMDPLLLAAATYFEQNLEEASGGRMQVEMVVGEAIVPTEETLEATRDGIFDMLYGFPTYYTGKIPSLVITEYCDFVIRTFFEGWYVYEELGLADILAPAYAEWNLQVISHWMNDSGSHIISKEPIPDFDSLAGLKVRAWGGVAPQLEGAGASMIWIPAEEIYTSLASGVVDAAIWGQVGAMEKMGFHELCHYVLAEPAITYTYVHITPANMDFWNNLPKAEQVLVKNIIDASGMVSYYEDNLINQDTMMRLDEVGLILNEWDESSIKKWQAVVAATLVRPEDPVGGEAFDLVMEWGRAMGYLPE